MMGWRNGVCEVLVLRFEEDAGIPGVLWSDSRVSVVRRVEETIAEDLSAFLAKAS